MRIASVGTALPEHRFSQASITEALLARWQHKLREPRLLSRLHANCGVDFRHFVLPLDAYPALDSFTATNNAWITHAVSLSECAIRRALAPAGLTPENISAIFFASVTGIASPTVDARLINRLPFPDSIKRTPIFGLGCVAGAAGIARAADYVRAFPHEIALLVSVELCSLTWQDSDQSIANLISCGLFGDGAAAVVICGEQAILPAEQAQLPNAAPGPRIGPRILATRSVFYRNTEYVMGWNIGASGFKIVLSPDVPHVVLENLRGNVEAFLADHFLSLADITSWIFHSGGPKVLEAVEQSLDLPSDALVLSWKSLREVGNLSAASVLFVLADTLASHRGASGSYSILAAMGPGFCLELVLLQW